MTYISNDIIVYKVRTAQDLLNAIMVRWQGYKRYFNDQASFDFSFWLEHYDLLPNSSLFLVKKNGKPIGSMRVQVNRNGKVELDEFLNLASILSGDKRIVAQSSRLSVPRGRYQIEAKLALWKAFYQFCLTEQVDTMLCSVQPCLGKAYEQLLFTDLGIQGEYMHPLNGRTLKTFKMDLNEAPKLLKKHKHPLFHFFFKDQAISRRVPTRNRLSA